MLMEQRNGEVTGSFYQYPNIQDPRNIALFIQKWLQYYYECTDKML